jgi:hypothetical protein
VGDQVGDRTKVSVDCQLVALDVVAGRLIFEVARSAGSVAGGYLRDVGEADRRVRLLLMVRVRDWRLG